MVKTRTICPITKAKMQMAKESGHLTVKEIMHRFGVSRSTVFRSVRATKNHLSIGRVPKNVGRPRRINQRNERQLKRCIYRLRRSEGQFTTKRLLLDMGLDKENISASTITRQLRRMGYYYLQARKKGMMTEADRIKRLAFAKKIRRNYTPDIWKNHICFFFGWS